MAFIETTPAVSADGDVLEMYRRQQTAWGYVPNYAKVFCHRPAVMKRWGKLLAEIRRPLDARRFELITFAAAQALRNSSCALAHGKALTDYFGIDEVCEIAGRGQPQGLTEAEAAMMAFSRKVALDASAITSADTDTLKSHGFTDADIFDIAATAAGRAFFTKILDALGSEPDQPFGEMDEALKAALFVGRPIDREPPEII